MENKKETSELRQDPVSRDWIIISSGRSKKPDFFGSNKNLHEETPINLCPFEDPKAHGNEIVKNYSSGIKVVNNKFPIIRGEVCNSEKRYGPYLIKDSAGYHEVVIFKDHKKGIAELDSESVWQIVSAYHDRYNNLKNKECANYILIIHNHGREAGASVSHPHSQILAIPFIPSDISRSLSGSAIYKMERKRCVHCDIIEWELKEQKRVIFENDSFVALVPYIPRFSYEIRIFPKKHQVFFEEANNLELKDFAEALRVSLAKIFHGLNNPAYNFFIHTPPTDAEHDYGFYHWHLEINPRLGVWGGFELGTGGEVINTDPDEAAEYLRNIKI
ncbi:MAG: galactose-1-phosphate uridylyltransferase [bacterium]|nr:galactose-1-phosphate uridylyltransferase [bacterium]